ncbi:MAG: DUF4437 domain-containing protein [Pseudomonadota bacterium]
MKALWSILVFPLFLGCLGKPLSSSGGVAYLPADQVQWQKLNPARGDKSPQAGTVWGDRKGEVETAFLAKFVDGFSSPPHIHNVTYRAIVIAGEIHNDDPKAANMWMPTGSYWTQPAGESHITSAKGQTNIALVEIDKGPYLVKPVKEEFDTGERPYNIHASNIIWQKRGAHKAASLWKNTEGQVTGTMVKFSKTAKISSEFARVVVISGEIQSTDQPKLSPGSVVTITKAQATLTCPSKTECLVYIKSNTGFAIN